MHNQKIIVKALIIILLVIPYLLVFLQGAYGIESTSIPNFHKVNENLYRGGRPGRQGIEELKGLGVRTVVNLEREIFEVEPGEVKKERRWAEESGMKFLRVPMHPVFSPKMDEIEKALEYITDPENQPVFIHCDRGSDRTGIVIAAYRIKIDGWGVEEAYEEMKKYGHIDWLLFWWKDVLYEFARKHGGKAA